MLKALPFARLTLAVFALVFAALTSAFPAGADAAEAASGGFNLSGVAAGGVYTRSTPQGLVIAGDGILIIEEADSSSRPAVRTEWRDGEEYAVTRWEYSGEGIYPCARVTTSQEGTTRVAFDADGMETEIAFFSSDGALVSRSSMAYAPATGDRGGHDLASRTDEAFSSSGEALASDGSVYTYNDDGSVKTRAIYKDGALVKLVEYSEKNSWTETVFYEGEALFTAEFSDGVRVRPGRRAAADAR